MKKIMALISCILFINCLWISSNAEIAMESETETEGLFKSTKEIDWTVQWQGYYYIGTYVGESSQGKPDGKGTFEGTVTDENKKSGAKMVYSGQWVSGKMEGTGELQDREEGIIYSGKFEDNKLNGLIKQYEDNSDGIMGEYATVYYADDIPYGIKRVYDSQGIIQKIDAFFEGISVSTLYEQARSFDYKDLLFNLDACQYQVVNLDCTVIDTVLLISDDEEKEDITYQTKVEDTVGNYYILTYVREFKKVAANYVPFLEKGDKISVLAYYTGVGTYGSEIVQIPCLDAVLVIREAKEDIDINDLEYDYENFLNYPYIYKDYELEVQGIFKGIIKTTDNWIYFLVENNSQDIFVCRVKNKEKNIAKLPNMGQSIELKGILQLPYCIEEEEDVLFYPQIKLTKIID